HTPPHSFPTRRSSDLKPTGTEKKNHWFSRRSRIAAIPVWTKVISFSKMLLELVGHENSRAQRELPGCERQSARACRYWSRNGRIDRKSTRLNSSHVSI